MFMSIRRYRVGHGKLDEVVTLSMRGGPIISERKRVF